jgi:hypothetical protein
MVSSSTRTGGGGGIGSGRIGRGGSGGGGSGRPFGAAAAAATTTSPVVGTEAIAQQQYTKNQRDFRYPPSGFGTKIEYSLLYAMVSRPDVYPATAVRDAIRAEDFTEYIWLVPTNASSSASQRTLDQNDPPESSYAQLCAILSLAVNKWPPPQPQPFEQNDVSNPTNAAVAAAADPLNIAQILCKALIHCVVRHAEEYNLDREHEVKDLLEPLERVTLARGRQTALAAVLPAYVGLGASILAGGNPLPFWIGYAMSINAVANQERELANFRDIATTTTRQAHPETASLLTDDDYDDNND